MKKRNALLFLGPPGSGKGSLSQLCISELGFKQVSTGDLCRDNVSKGTEIGKKIDFLIKSGTLISDTLVTQMIQDWFQKNPGDTTVIVDGYPRTVAQAKLFDSLMTTGQLLLHPLVVRLVVDDEVVVNRLSSRLVCQNKKCQAVYSGIAGSDLLPKQPGICDRCGHQVGRRSDDEPRIIRDRLAVYHQHESALLDFYKRAGYVVIDLDGNQPLEAILQQFRREVDGLLV